MVPRAIVKKVDPYTRAYPDEVPVKATITFADGRSMTRERRDYPGFKSTPLEWPDVIAKFERLSAPAADEARRAAIVEAVRGVDAAESLDELTRLLRLE